MAAGVLIFLFATANLLLIRQNLQLRAELRRYQPDELQTGDRLPPFSAKELSGEPLAVSYDGRGPKRVLLFFTPTCRYCRGQFAYWRELMERADRERFEIIGVVAEMEDASKVGGSFSGGDVNVDERRAGLLQPHQEMTVQRAALYT